MTENTTFVNEETDLTPSSIASTNGHLGEKPPAIDVNSFTPPPTNGFTTDIDVNAFCIAQDGSTSGIEVEKILVSMPIRKPRGEEFIRACPDPQYRKVVFLYEDKQAMGALYVVHPSIQPLIATFVHTYQIVLCVNTNNTAFFLPLRLYYNKGGGQIS